MEIPRNGDDAKGTLIHLQKGHKYLSLRFNACLPTEHQVTSSPERTGKKVKKVQENCDLPWEVLDIISERLDFDDLFHFSAVCKSWRVSYTIYWTNFLASQAPLLIEICFSKPIVPSYSFRSLPDQKCYWWKMMNLKDRFKYYTSSSGYFIMWRKNTILLINPFTRIKKVINTTTFDEIYDCRHALLAFGKCSEEFVLVVLCGWPRSVHVYQSRNCAWITYRTMEDVGVLLDFIVFHNIIYVVTSKSNIGVLSLNSSDIKFLKLESAPNVSPKPGHYPHIALVNCDEQLLLVHLKYKEIKDVYKIDFSTMSYVKLKTLGDNALFYSPDKSCYALSNPNKWGYESNSVYVCYTSSVEVGAYS
jgi:hypothetical protein